MPVNAILSDDSGEQAASLPTYDDIRGTVSSMLFLWASIEAALADAMDKLFGGEPPKSAHRISARIDLWLEMMEQHTAGNARLINICKTLVQHLKVSLRLRNMICHGLRGAAASNARTGEPAHVLVQLDGQVRKIYWQEFHDMFSWMSRTHWMIAELTGCATGLAPAKIEETIYVWELFPEIR